MNSTTTVPEQGVVQLGRCKLCYQLTGKRHMSPVSISSFITFILALTLFICFAEFTENIVQGWNKFFPHCALFFSSQSDILNKSVI